MRTRTAAVAAALFLVPLTACGGNTGDAKADASASPSPTEASSDPAAEPTITRQPVLKMGETWAFESTGEDAYQGDVTVLDYKQGIKSVGSAEDEAGTKGYEWAYVELKTCSATGTLTADFTPWAIAYEDGARVEASSTTYDDFPKPEYPAETTLTTGKCVRGKLVFAVPGDTWPHTIVYSPYGLDTPQEWAIPTEG
ncbi:DUF4352 domain-containing protein [Streptomyces sp. SYSU K21746]